MHPVGRTCDVGLDIPGVVLPDDFKKLSGTLQRPRSKKEEPVSLELNPDNTLGMWNILCDYAEKILRSFPNFKFIESMFIPLCTHVKPRILSIRYV